MNVRRVLILGGTTEAAALAERLVRDRGDRLDVTTSLAGRTAAPKALPGRVRTGGFGGSAGLAAYLASEKVDALIDATHPFAQEMSAHAAEAAARTRVPRLVLARAPWAPVSGDRWIDAADIAGAVGALRARAALTRIFLTVGSGGIASFAAVPLRFFLVRVAEPPIRPASFADYAVVVDRGPFAFEKEIALLREHRIEAVVSKNAGGAATYAKIAAARALTLPVIMIARPKPVAGDTAFSVDEAEAWLAGVLARSFA
jgi:precorrin-6A/cobalt-precorrin-6A reductase